YKKRLAVPGSNHARPHQLNIANGTEIVANLHVVAIDEIVLQIHLVVVEKCVAGKSHGTAIDRGEERHLVVRVAGRVHHGEFILFPLKRLAIAKSAIYLNRLREDTAEDSPARIGKDVHHIFIAPDARSVFAHQMRDAVRMIIVIVRGNDDIQPSDMVVGLKRLDAVLDETHASIDINRVAKALEEAPAR